MKLLHVGSYGNSFTIHMAKQRCLWCHGCKRVIVLKTQILIRKDKHTLTFISILTFAASHISKRCAAECWFSTDCLKWLIICVCLNQTNITFSPLLLIAKIMQWFACLLCVRVVRQRNDSNWLCDSPPGLSCGGIRNTWQVASATVQPLWRCSWGNQPVSYVDKCVFLSGVSSLVSKAP